MTPHTRFRIPLAAFALVALVGWIGAIVLWSAAGRTEQLRLSAAADEAAHRIGERVRLHLLLIEATAAMIEAQGEALSADGFAEYYEQLQLSARYPGIAGLGYAPLRTRAELPALLDRLAADYGRAVELWPAHEGEFVAPVGIIGSTDVDDPRAVGYDMYSDATRREAMDAAIAAGAPRATEPLKLATDTEPSPGFIVYAPIYGPGFGALARADAPGEPTGFAFGGFRVAELAGAALNVFPYLPVAVTVRDAETPDLALYASGREAAAAPWRPKPETRSLDVASQTWTLEFQPTATFASGAGRHLALAFGAISTAFAAMAAYALFEQGRARAAAEALAVASVRSVAEKDLLLQEMKHRIKNAIARILAIARQTSTQSVDIKEFTASFTQRLQAMAEAQDMLTRSATEKADLAELLARELVQVFGPAFDPTRLTSEKVELDAPRTQALGLVFHELATNALKYGGADGTPPRIDVQWRVTPTEPPALDLTWRERGGRVTPPDKAGFGTKLIDASLRHELGARIEREWLPEGLNLRFHLPLGPV